MKSQVCARGIRSVKSFDHPSQSPQNIVIDVSRHSVKIEARTQQQQQQKREREKNPNQMCKQ